MNKLFYIIMKNQMYLIETQVPTRIKFCTVGKPKLFINKKNAEKQCKKIGGVVVKVKMTNNGVHKEGDYGEKL